MTNITDEQIDAIDLRAITNYETGGGWLRAYARAVLALQPSEAVPTDEQIKSVFMEHGFTIKEGQTDLKPYVYAAARALLALASSQVEP